jgi:hypothetical protein
MKKFLLGPGLAALAIFIWGFAYWGAPHHLPYKLSGTVPDDVAAMEALGKIFPASGVYLLPNPLKGDDAMAANAKLGLAQLNLVKEAQPGFDPKVMVLGLAHSYVVCVLLTLMLTRLAGSFHCYSSRVKFCAMLGLVVAVYDYTMAVWWKQPVGWVTAGAFYNFISFVIAGLILAKFVAPKAVPAPAAVS